MALDPQPVSAHIAAEVREFVRRHGIVVWLDGDGTYRDLSERLHTARQEGALAYEVRLLRGSYLELMLQLGSVAKGAEKVPLLLHMPGHTEESVRTTPLLELYEAGTRFRKALPTAVSEAAAGLVPPDEIAAFLRDRAKLTLAEADTWLTAKLAGRHHGPLAILQAMQPAAVLDDLLAPGGGPVAAQLGRPETEDALWAQWQVWLGLPQAWRAHLLPKGAASARDIAFCVAGWTLAIEYVDDLRRPPQHAHLLGIPALPKPLRDNARTLCDHLRTRHADFYQRTADETEALLAEEVEIARAEDLGKIDTFRFEEDKVLLAALDAMAEQRWAFAGDWSRDRLGGQSFWLGRHPERAAAWRLIGLGAALGQRLAAAAEAPALTDGLDAATHAYVARGASVDRAHRHLEQARSAQLLPQIPHFERLRSLLDALRGHWRQWADAWAVRFSAICKRDGFLPAPGLQQRQIFDDAVRPLTQEPGLTAYFMVDALRYEMAEELRDLLGEGPATTVTLKPRLAELPTLTSVGMNALAPVAVSGRMDPVLTPATNGWTFDGFRTAELRITDPESRRRAAHDRVGGETCPLLSLADVLNRDSASLRRAVARARLIIVHSGEIDIAGESGLRPADLDHALQQLRAAWHLLREAGVQRFVFTADHGFLLHPDGQPDVQAHGRKVDPKRRHVLSALAADHLGEARVPLRELGYQGSDLHLMMPESTAVFDTGQRSQSFVHGGNSLQERVIPLLILIHRAKAGGSTSSFDVVVEPREQVAGMHCLHISLTASGQSGLEFGRPTDVELALRAVDAPGVQVDLCQVRGNAQLAGATITANPGQPFEVFFRLVGPEDGRIPVEVFHPSAAHQVRPATTAGRFEVAAARVRLAEAAASVGSGVAWLAQLPDGGVRELFAHLHARGVVTESEAQAMLGSARALRMFSLDFERHAEAAPFLVRIEVVAGVKRYVRQGARS
jgi:hypothetical protein